MKPVIRTEFIKDKLFYYLYGKSTFSITKSITIFHIVYVSVFQKGRGHVHLKEGEGLTKCPYYYISLIKCKVVHKGGPWGGVKYIKNCPRGL